MEFLSHLPTGILVGLIVVLLGAMGWMVKIVYKLIFNKLTEWSDKVSSEFASVKESFVKTDGHLEKMDRRIDLLFIEIKASDFANDHFLSNGERYIDIKEAEKQRLIRDHEFLL